ncbi:MAG: hypothetical protein OEW52_09035 [Thermoleophilia bacterium]|nr:hypothetical protein [Thermoleophilia bacterium]MDH4341099.1 hypothetical protein [Thermoleophilia bacterium]MDH5281276.1 hypothetical protein [Thermoleophilia bacterium]
MRVLIALVTLVAALAVGVSTALATTVEGKGGGLTVSVSLPPSATRGEPITVAESITNDLQSWQLVKVTQTLQGPAGRQLSFSYPILVGPYKTLAFNLTFTVPTSAPTGEYSLTLATKTKTGSATATATIEVS